MKLLQNLLTPEEIDLFKEYWNSDSNRGYVNWHSEGHLYSERSEYIDKRLEIKDHPVLSPILRRIVDQQVKKDIRYWANYQRQSLPHMIHIDDYGKGANWETYTIIIAVDTNPKFKTYVWKEEAQDNDKLHEFCEQWGRLSRITPRVSNISEIEDLEHTRDLNNGKYMADWLHLDGIFEYKSGSGVLFKTTQFHTTSNWCKYPEIAYRDLIQLHIGVPGDLSIDNSKMFTHIKA
jgi:hypothetical protein